MPQYVILQGHPPGNCPLASKGAREWFKKMFPEMDNVAKKLGVELVVPYIHLDPAHKGLMLLEAPSAEVARDFLMQAGFFHFVDMEFYLVTPIADLVKDIDRIPTIYP
ncbi:MAG: hypothetical protein QXK69_12835 [Candidatus Caldarchaeum sp.]